ncbi:MAG: nickel-responsive transcriptional regulator NikR [Acidobacteriaceae bacterium]|nr:nickel-responsive transcriptional regulator NikR [Acidobacteriaceae bacterium]
MGFLSRIGVAIDSDLLKRFDTFIAKQGYTNRSEAFRDLIRDRLVMATVDNPRAPVVGTVTLIYDHHSRMLPDKLMDLQHDHHRLIVCTTHAHLDHATCMEVIILKGESRQLQKLAEMLIATKGVRHGRLVMSSPGTALAKSA